MGNVLMQGLTRKTTEERQEAKPLELQAIEAMIFQHLERQEYHETANVFSRDADLQMQLTQIPNEDLLNLVHINEPNDHLMNFINEEDDSGSNSLMSNIINYYSKVGSEGIFSQENVRKLNQISVGLA